MGTWQQRGPRLPGHPRQSTRRRPCASHGQCLFGGAAGCPHASHVQLLTPPPPRTCGVDGLGAANDHRCRCQRAPAAARGSVPARPLLLPFTPQRPWLSPCHRGLGTWVLSQGSWTPAAKPAGRGWGCTPQPHSPLLLGLPGGPQLPCGKHLLLNNQVGKLRHKAARAMPGLEGGGGGADLVRCHLPPASRSPAGVYPLPTPGPGSSSPCAVLCPGQDPGGPGGGGKTALLAVATPRVPAPPRGKEMRVASPQ